MVKTKTPVGSFLAYFFKTDPFMNLKNISNFNSTDDILVEQKICFCNFDLFKILNNFCRIKPLEPYLPHVVLNSASICRTLLSSPLLRRKKASFDSSEEDVADLHPR
jgi:hypothetical protein